MTKIQCHTGLEFMIVCLQTTAMVRARMLYERLVTQFPTSGRYWRLYIEQEVNE